MHWYARPEEWTAQVEDARQATDVDCARPIQPASFRKLQGETQLLNLGNSDFLLPSRPTAWRSPRSRAASHVGSADRELFTFFAEKSVAQTPI